MAPPPAFSDISKQANDLINKDFYHSVAALFEVKLKTPNGVSVTTKGTSPHDGATSGSVEAKQTVSKGVTTTLATTTSKVVTSKVEVDNVAAQGLKSEILTSYHLDKGLTATKISLFFKQPAFHTRAFVDYSPAGGALSAVVDGIVGHEGFLVGGEAGYDVQKATITRYSAALGHQTALYTAALLATKNLSVVQASYYQKVNPSVEVGIKAVYDLKASTSVGLEIASKYKIDPLSFAKTKINDRGILSLAYNTKVNSGLTFGLGASLDTTKLNEAGHKIGASFTFEG